MSELSIIHKDAHAGGAPHWTARHGKPIVFVILTLVAVGIYLALTIPVAVFPETNFPRIVIGADNGVYPIDQILVTVTRPLEEAVNTVPGLDHVWSITSRGTSEIDLFFSWKVDMYRTLELVNAAIARVQPTLPPTAQDHRQPPDLRRLHHHGLQPDLGHRSANPALGDGHLRYQAAAQSHQWRLDRGGARRTGPRVPGANPTRPGWSKPERPFQIFSTPSAAAI